jgi:hypothetical protein
VTVSRSDHHVPECHYQQSALSHQLLVSWGYELAITTLSSWVSPPICCIDLTGLAGSQTAPACVSPPERPALAPVPDMRIELGVAVAGFI